MPDARAVRQRDRAPESPTAKTSERVRAAGPAGSQLDSLAETNAETPVKRSLLSRLAFFLIPLLVVLAALIIVLWAGSRAGWIDLRQQLGKIPFLAGLTAVSPDPGELVVPGTTLLERENQRLMQELNGQRDEVQRLTGEKQALEVYIKALEQKVALLESDATEKTADTPSQVDYKQLAAYFSEMKPANAEAVMGNMEDEMVLGIFANMDSDQVAKIMAIMPAERAALLSSKVTVQP